MGPLIAPGLKAERRFARGAFETWRFGKVKVSGLEVVECWSFLVSLCVHISSSGNRPVPLLLIPGDISNNPPFRNKLNSNRVTMKKIIIVYC